MPNPRAGRARPALDDYLFHALLPPKCFGSGKSLLQRCVAFYVSTSQDQLITITNQFSDDTRLAPSHFERCNN